MINLRKKKFVDRKIINACNRYFLNFEELKIKSENENHKQMNFYYCFDYITYIFHIEYIDF